MAKASLDNARSSFDEIEKELAAARKAMKMSEKVTPAAPDATGVPEVSTVATNAAALQWKQDVESYLRVLRQSSEMHDELELVLCRVRGLSGILQQRSNRRNTSSSFLYKELYQRELIPLCDYGLQLSLDHIKSELHSLGYPHCCENEDRALATLENVQRLRTLCSNVHELQQHHRNDSTTPLLDPLLVEICRPHVERVRFHFLETSMDRPTTTRIDRLTEWLSQYMQDHTLSNSVLIFIDAVAPWLVDDFINEMLRLVLWVLTKRDVFRHPHILAQPRLLSNAIQHILQLDAVVQDFISVDEEEETEVENASMGQGRVIPLASELVAGDMEGWDWWCDRERESNAQALSTSGLDAFPALWFSARAKNKATSSDYQDRVMVPLVMAAMEHLHGQVQIVRKEWTGRNVTPARFARLVQQYQSILEDAERLVEVVAQESSNGDEHRLVQSLQGLTRAIHEDGVTDCVEKIILERAQMAKYVMQCSHWLSMDTVDSIVECQDISVDLMETQRILVTLLEYANSELFNRVLTAVAEQLLEVVLNWSGTTPELRLGGIRIFARDTRALLEGADTLPPQAQRLLQLTELLETDGIILASLIGTLRDLSGKHHGPLQEEMFGSDDRLYDQATAMLQAKGVGVAVELSDAISIFNRLPQPHLESTQYDI